MKYKIILGSAYLRLVYNITMQNDLEIRFCNMHALYMQHSTEDAEDVLEWMWSFLILSSTAVYIIERPPDLPPTKHDISLCCYLDSLTSPEHVPLPWTKKHAYEWLMKAGELRLWLNDSWTGQWNVLEMDALTRDFVAVLDSLS